MGGAGAVPASADAQDPRVPLGQQLYFDTRLSKAGKTSCMTCHDLTAGGVNGKAFAVNPDGTRTRHSVLTVWNAALMNQFFWYGTASSLEEQALGPLGDMAEGDIATVVAGIAAIPGYAKAFSNAFPGTTPAVTQDNIAAALAAFERTLVTTGSPFDQGKLNSAATRGRFRFIQLGCSGCHTQPLFSSGGMMPFPLHVGTAIAAEHQLEDDQGRFVATGVESDRRRFRVPTLRNVELTAPYFHNGSVTTLDEAVRVMGQTQLGLTISDADVSDLVAFLKGLTGQFPTVTPPQLPPVPGT
jgi:cytochrome c peroxidase